MFAFTPLKALIVSSWLALLVGCNETVSSDAGAGYQNTLDTEFNQASLVTHLVDQVITPSFEAFAEQAQLQQQAIAHYCDALTLDHQQSAQQAWMSAMDAWQLVEMMQVGPLVDNDHALRQQIYAWPVMSRCGIDLDVVAFENNDIAGSPYRIEQRTPARKGMAAIEYLLFNQELNHSCTGATQPSSWNSRTDQSRTLARCQFAEEVARDVHNNANQLVEQWLADQGEAMQLKTAGQASSQYASAHEAVNHLSDALFYLDSMTKDTKLATPLGLFANNCGTSVCPQDLESPYAGYALNNIQQNLRAMQQLITGEQQETEQSHQQAIGFDDFLIDVDANETASQLLQAIEAAIANSQAQTNAPLAQALLDNEQQVLATHAAVKQVTDTLKTDFIESLALELPATSAGDND